MTQCRSCGLDANSYLGDNLENNYVSMFKNLFDFSFKRSGVQALGFYIVFLLIGVLIGGLLGGIAGLFSADSSFEAGYRIGWISAIIYNFAMAAIVIVKKKEQNNVALWLLAILAAGLGYLGGTLLGMIPVAYLTTRPVKGAKGMDKKDDHKKEDKK